jgi:hypothetical protein
MREESPIWGLSQGPSLVSRLDFAAGTKKPMPPVSCLATLALICIDKTARVGYPLVHKRPTPGVRESDFQAKLLAHSGHTQHGFGWHIGAVIDDFAVHHGRPHLTF